MTALQTTTTITTSTNSEATETWKDWLPDIRTEMGMAGIDDCAKGFDIAVAKVCSMENRKGLLMYGGTGSGKTKRLRFLARTSPALITFTTAQQICEWWQCSGDRPTIMRELYQADMEEYFAAKPEMRVCDICVDDLGTEAPETFAFGNRCDVMRDVFLPMRYNIFPEGKTYITTNLTPDQLKQRYGERIYSRLMEMCFFMPVIHQDRRIA